MAKNKEQGPILSEEFIKNIDNYSSKIKTIVNFVDAVRKRPGMYIGPRGSMGFLNMIREVFQNALDQLVRTDSPCDLVKIIYDMRDGGVVTISDNGMGIPFDDIIRVYTTAHTSGNYVKHAGEYSAGLNGIGAKATNALSSRFEVTSYKYNGEAKQVLFEKGKMIYEKMIPNPDHHQGTTVIFTPDKDIMGDTYLDSGILYMLICDMLSLTAIGNKVEYTSITEHGKVHNEVIVNEFGILMNLMNKCGDSMLVTPITISQDTGFMKLDAAFTFNANCMDGENITAYANMCPTSTVPANTHVKGFIDGLCAWFVKYMNNTYLGEKSKIKVIQNDIKAGLSAMISAFHLEPDFTGQAKEVFSNSDYTEFAKNATMLGIEEWSKNRPQELIKVCKFIKDCAEVRMKADTEKVKITAKYATSATTGLPQKYRRPTGPASLGWELIIVEGDSAESSASQGRDEKRQGIFPIRGKILNVYDATPEKIRGNVEIMGIANILGAGFGKNFDIKKIKFQKIIFLTDADADGAHIASLLLLLFLKLFPGLVESGMVYKAVPPLYGITKGKKHTYFTERKDFATYMQKQFFTDHQVCEFDGRPVGAAKFTNFLLENEDYVYEVDAIANRYKIDPNLLEMLLVSNVENDNYNKIKRKLTGAYRFLNDENIVKDGNTIKIKGLVNKEVQTIFYNERFLKDCENILPFVRRAVLAKEITFQLDGNSIGLYQLVKSVEESNSTGLNRFKGLGEMDGPSLGESALRPDSNRMLVRYTVEDINKDIQTIRTYESNKKMILEHIDTVKRMDLIG